MKTPDAVAVTAPITIEIKGAVGSVNATTQRIRQARWQARHVVVDVRGTGTTRAHAEDALAQAAGLPQTRISEIVRGKRTITTDTALRLSKALGVDDRFWLNIQTDFDVEVERDLHGAELAKVTALVAG